MGSVAELAKRKGVLPNYVRRLSRLAFLASKIVEAIATGHQPPELTAKTCADFDRFSEMSEIRGTGWWMRQSGANRSPQDSLIIRENTGNFRDFDPLEAELQPNRVHQRPYQAIPYRSQSATDHISRRRTPAWWSRWWSEFRALIRPDLDHREPPIKREPKQSVYLRNLVRVESPPFRAIVSHRWGRSGSLSALRARLIISTW